MTDNDLKIFRDMAIKLKAEVKRLPASWRCLDDVLEDMRRHGLRINISIDTGYICTITELGRATHSGGIQQTMLEAVIEAVEAMKSYHEVLERKEKHVQHSSRKV